MGLRFIRDGVRAKLILATLIACVAISACDAEAEQHIGKVLMLDFQQQRPSSFGEAKKVASRINYGTKTFYCGCDFGQNHKGKLVPDLKGCGTKARKNENRANRIEWEHVVPAHWFGAQRRCWQEGGRKNCARDPEFRAMEADLFNLRPAIGEINGDRSNYRFSMIEGEARSYGACDFEVDFKGKKAEPAPHIRGDIARTYFYFSRKYRLQISKSQLRLLKAWDRQDPVDDAEIKWHRKTAQVMGWSNPYIEAFDRQK